MMPYLQKSKGLSALLFLVTQLTPMGLWAFLPGLGPLIGLSAAFGQTRVPNPLAPLSRPWTVEDAAHLLRRAGFGGTPEQIEQLHQMGLKAAVDYLVDYDKVRVNFESLSSKQILPFAPDPFRDGYAPSQEERNAYVKIRKRNDWIENANMTEWWLRRMVATPRPLEEKLALFWHGHFTSGLREVKLPGMMLDQQQVFRDNALKDFRSMLAAICIDPAMMRYLDNVNNVVKEPNENFGRELLELFTIGVGHYTELDIKSVARAFTGWTVSRATGRFEYNTKAHDYSPTKMIFGRMGDINGGQVVDMILARPETAEHIAGRLWTYFAGQEPSAAFKKALGRTFFEQRLQFRPFLKLLFSCQAFYSPEVVGQRIKSPVELIVGMYRELEIRPYNAAIMARGAREMGQELFQPPNVKGWDGGLKWINTASLMERYNYPLNLLYGCKPPDEKPEAVSDIPELLTTLGIAERAANMEQPPFDPYPILKRYDLKTPSAIVDHFARRLLAVPLDETAKKKLENYFALQLGGEKKGSEIEHLANVVRGLIHLMMSSPEYQLN